jgi:hypothetical protein
MDLQRAFLGIYGVVLTIPVVDISGVLLHLSLLDGKLYCIGILPIFVRKLPLSHLDFALAQHRPVRDSLIAACEAALRGEAAPSLLPTPAVLEQLLRAAA